MKNQDEINKESNVANLPGVDSQPSPQVAQEVDVQKQLAEMAANMALMFSQLDSLKEQVKEQAEQIDILKNENQTLNAKIKQQDEERHRLFLMTKSSTGEISELKNIVGKQAVEISRLKLKLPDVSANQPPKMIGNPFGDLFSFESSFASGAPKVIGNDIMYSSKSSEISKISESTGELCNLLAAPLKPLTKKFDSVSAVFASGAPIMCSSKSSEISKISEPTEELCNLLAASKPVTKKFDSVLADSLVMSESPTVPEDDEATRRKRINRILASVPCTDTTNPIAAAVNFCKHQLRFDLDSNSVKITESDDGIYTVQVYFPGHELVASASNRKKKTAKEIACKNLIIRLNKEQEFLSEWINWSLDRSNSPRPSR